MKLVNNFYPFVCDSFPCESKTARDVIQRDLTYPLRIFVNHSYHWQLYFRWRTHISPQISCQIWPPYTFVLRWGTVFFLILKTFQGNLFCDSLIWRKFQKIVSLLQNLASCSSEFVFCRRPWRPNMFQNWSSGPNNLTKEDRIW